MEAEGDLLYSRVLGFSSLEGLVDVVHWALYFVFFPDQSCTHRDCGYS